MCLTLGWVNRFEVKPGTWVYEPSAQSRKHGRSIITNVKKKWTSPLYYFHLRDGGHVKALEKHINNKFFASLDIKDFFGSISRTRITRTLKEYFGYDLARKIAKISTVKHHTESQHSHSLPYGFVQSPLLASICLHKSTLGIELDKCFKDTNITVSLYMDDIVLSSKNEKIVTDWIEKLKDAAIRSKFTLNSQKESLTGPSVVAFNIELAHHSMSITKSRFDKFLFEYKNSTSKAQQEGIGGYVGSVNKIQATLLDL